MIPFVAFSLGRAWQGFWRNALMSLAATLTMVLMLLLLAGFFILQNVLLASLSFVEQKVEVVAYVIHTATEDQVDDLVARVDAMPETASVEFVSREEALGPVPRGAAGAGPRGPDARTSTRTRCTPASTSSSPRRPASGAVADALRERAGRAQRAQHRGAGRPGDDRDGRGPQRRASCCSASSG